MTEIIRMPVDVYEDIKKVDKSLVGRSVVFLPEPERTNELIKIVEWYLQLDKPNLERATEFASLIRGVERTAQLEKVLKIYVSQGELLCANSMAKEYMERSLTIEELITMFRFHVDKEDVDGAKGAAKEIVKHYEKINSPVPSEPHTK